MRFVGLSLSGLEARPRIAPRRQPHRRNDRVVRGVEPRTHRRASEHSLGDPFGARRGGRRAELTDCQRLSVILDAPPPVHAYAPGSWGPEAADKLVAGFGRWHGPWLAS